ncbi:hypothetical protein N4T20_13795 [Flavobacterium sp. TR2]|uniref:hypothetical protein n=1 Tax=Flavobacterium sp. TR2 TaxID=2977321 RepID=UPI0021B0CC37|nr:hypothetical protein [Flavobacterium sp. TR2]UWY26792.1 hypothetical protein N4T20_13795 [Flavobacterium sp. TR2]
MKQIVISIFGSILIISCKPKSEFKTIDFVEFEITVPRQWNELKFKGIDSYVGGIITPEKDSLIFDIGRYSSDITEEDFVIIYDKRRYNELNENEKKLLKKENYLIIDSISQEVDREKYRRQKFVVEKVDCFQAKFITPRKSGLGVTGIYIDSLRGNSKDFTKVRMCFYGYNLKQRTQQQFVNALRTIKFKEYCYSEK